MRTAGLADMNASCDLGGTVSNLSCGKRSREGKRRDAEIAKKKTAEKPLPHEEKDGARDPGSPFRSSGQGIEDYDGLIGARDYGFGYGD